jgi:hypothetical protein
VALASQWLSALGKRDVQALSRLTRFPFKMHDTSATGDCENRSAGAPAALGGAVSCLLENDLLLNDLREDSAGRKLFVRAIARGNLPSWARRWRSDLPADLQSIWATVVADGVTWDLLLLVGKQGVAGLWKAGWFDPN